MQTVARFVSTIVVLLLIPVLIFAGGGMEILLLLPGGFILAVLLVLAFYKSSVPFWRVALYVLLTILALRLLTPVVPFDDRPELWLQNILALLGSLVSIYEPLCHGSSYYCYKFAEADSWYPILQSLLLGWLVALTVAFFGMWVFKKKDRDVFLMKRAKGGSIAITIGIGLYMLYTVPTILTYAHTQGVEDEWKQICVDAYFREHYKKHPDENLIYNGQGCY